MKQQKSTDWLRYLPHLFLIALGTFLAVRALLSQKLSDAATLAVFAFVWFLVYRVMRRLSRSIHDDHRKEILLYSGTRFDEALEKVREFAVAVAEELATRKPFPVREGVGQAYYFEWKEIVFRLEKSDDGRAVIALRNENRPNQCSEATPLEAAEYRKVPPRSYARRGAPHA